ncbi:hypothetical protein [Azoarcus olearius]|uniref:Hypothetical membrane protein n=1 Tax=Azoarcus sp. (strain BH72) TaxID=418699 RepID=A1K1V9_AZOSB|nr:hypothetical protein [Azoarcus olearius]ANQ83288.1 hypothetical protein dqs_0211 [Azoarcus olearius]CAL92814.1 hypothetical membrane protein [Azoarcus olearius]
MKSSRPVLPPPDDVLANRRRLVFSLALLSLPLAFQFAEAAIVPVPEAMRIVLAFSVWATLVVLELSAGALVWALCRALRRLRQGGMPAWRAYPR